MIGDKEVSFNKNFRLFMTTRDINPQFSPELCSIVKNLRINKFLLILFNLMFFKLIK